MVLWTLFPPFFTAWKALPGRSRTSLIPTVTFPELQEGSLQRDACPPKTHANTRAVKNTQFWGQGAVPILSPPWGSGDTLSKGKCAAWTEQKNREASDTRAHWPRAVAFLITA